MVTPPVAQRGGLEVVAPERHIHNVAGHKQLHGEREHHGDGEQGSAQVGPRVPVVKVVEDVPLGRGQEAQVPRDAQGQAHQ
eukprot:CAMPEP_0113951044 /NCGR_PEP_ID=MMETSP1339-20121228/84076_1 /TAXON_ID=94617 /ORGANISM="Fibrocapsa japonica" /LENGTH=80 /DNA_ID=CAMNT_0000959155 /DNA_START=147 /DNA_END=385 /DNA_ORIENTATION=- /assembly_acc=CAM_ASM_000762